MNDELLIDVLKAAGHEDAAALAAKMLEAREPPAPPAPPEEPATPEPQEPPQVPTAGGVSLLGASTLGAREAEGQYVLGRLKRDLRLDGEAA
jgi:hypothetical protein